MEKQYVFLMVPNNSGSHVLAHLLMSSKKVAAIPGLEGLFLKSFGEPPTKNTTAKHAFMFTSIENDLRKFPISRWEEVKKVWDHEWDRFPDRPIKIEKSPPLICAHNAYPKVFDNYKYIVMVRNPFAVAEGMIRNVKKRSNQDISTLEAIVHSVRVLEICDEIVKTHKDNSIFFTYEEFTENPELIKNKIIDFIPEVSDMKIYDKYDIKGEYYSGIKNMNEEQINRIPEKSLKIMEHYLNYKKQTCKDPNSFIFKY